jgi:hypothetical protein
MMTEQKACDVIGIWEDFISGDEDTFRFNFLLHFFDRIHCTNTPAEGKKIA